MPGPIERLSAEIARVAKAKLDDSQIYLQFIQRVEQVPAGRCARGTAQKRSMQWSLFARFQRHPRKILRRVLKEGVEHRATQTLTRLGKGSGFVLAD